MSRLLNRFLNPYLLWPSQVDYRTPWLSFHSPRQFIKHPPSSLFFGNTTLQLRNFYTLYYMPSVGEYKSVKTKDARSWASG
jgi:hypothetical protein